jgi:recombination protein RecR
MLRLKSELRKPYPALQFIGASDVAGNAGPEIERLAALARLPGLGPRSARKAVLALLKRRMICALPLAEALQEAVAKISECPMRQFRYRPTLQYLPDTRRDQSLIVVVEEACDL